MIASVSTSSKIVVEKSTVPVKTAEAIEKVRGASWICSNTLIAFRASQSVVCQKAGKGCRFCMKMEGVWESSWAECTVSGCAGAQEELRGPQRAL